MRHNSTVARDGNCCTTLNPTKKLGQVGLRLGGLNLLNHERTTDRFDRLDHTPRPLSGATRQPAGRIFWRQSRPGRPTLSRGTGCRGAMWEAYFRGQMIPWFMQAMQRGMAFAVMMTAGCCCGTSSPLGRGGTRATKAVPSLEGGERERFRARGRCWCLRLADCGWLDRALRLPRATQASAAKAAVCAAFGLGDTRCSRGGSAPLASQRAPNVLPARWRRVPRRTSRSPSRPCGPLACSTPLNAG